jgi:hypothetical protein
MRRWIATAGLIASLFAALPGCGWFGGEPEPADEEASLPLESITTAAAEPEPPAVPESEPPSPSALRVGEAFPMLRSVTQTLTQNPPGGRKVTHSTLQAMLTLRIEELTPDGRRRIGVRYDRVRYMSDLNGEPIDFDSGVAQAALPPEAGPYRGLADNGFSFWAAPNGAVLELVGYGDFLRRCVRDVPPGQHDQVLQKLAGLEGGEALASLVDDSLALVALSADTATPAAGNQWMYRRRMIRPVSILLDARCTVSAVNEGSLEIDLAGILSPAAAYEQLSDPEPVQVSARGGRSVGHVTMDRRTGLPVQSRVEHYVDMLVQPPDGEPFEQRKHIVTSLQALPTQTASATP